MTAITNWCHTDITMPKPDNSKKMRKNIPPSDESDADSIDSKGNLRNLIDYDYSEEEEERPTRKAAVVAKRRLRRLAELRSDSSNSTPIMKKKHKPTLVVESESESEEEPRKKSKKRVVESESEEEPRKKSKKRVVESESESEEEPRKKSKKRVVESESEEEPRKKTKKRVVESESEEESYEDDYDSDEDDEEYEDDEDEDEVEDYSKSRRKGSFDIVISDLFGGGRDPNKPQKYNLKKESASVRRFVELVQKEEEEEDNIDNDIAYFKSLGVEKQASLLKILEHKAAPVEVAVPLKFKILEKVSAKPELNRIAMSKYNALCNIEPSSTEYYKVSHWINGFTGMPLGIYKDLPVRIEDGPEKCHEFMTTVHKCMDTAIHGHDEAKLQIMQFVSNWIANPTSHGNVLSIHGPPGVGKTSLVKDGIAKALGRPFHFISLGGATDASFLDGHSYTYEGSTWGKIVDVLIHSKCMNPVIYFDELDKVSDTPKGDEIMNILIHLTDGAQNDRFQDKYFTGIDLDLSRCLFIFSHNNHEKVNPILRDRMYNIAVKGFDNKQKTLIAEEYLIPSALKEAGLHEKISINKEIIQHVIEHFTDGEAGVRELKRCIQTIISKINLLRFYNNPKQVPFAIEGFSLPFTIKKTHVDLFLKKKDPGDTSYLRMYI
jgi:hypothetical protein